MAEPVREGICRTKGWKNVPLTEELLPMLIQIGNSHAIEGYRDPDDASAQLEFHPQAGHQITEIHPPENMPEDEIFNCIIGTLEHNLAPGEKPDWISCPSADITARVLDHFDMAPDSGHRPLAMGAVPLMLFGFIAVFFLRLFSLHLRTNTGRDWMARIMGDTASTGTGAYAPANWIGVSADTNAPQATDSSLTGEINTGTLVRALAAYAHTTGQSAYTLTKTFTSDRTVILAKMGAFNAGSSGTMVFEALLDNVASLESGDQVQITDTITL